MSHHLLTERQWNIFFNTLEGPEGCDFQEKVKGDPESITWRCKGGWDQSYAKAILAKMGIPEATATEVLTYCREYGGHCDCEILMNAVERVYEDIDSEGR